MKRPHLDVTQNDKSGLHGKCSSCDAYFTVGGPGLARNPAVAKTLQRRFDKHCRQVHREDFSQAAARIERSYRAKVNSICADLIEQFPEQRIS